MKIAALLLLPPPAGGSVAEAPAVTDEARRRRLAKQSNANAVSSATIEPDGMSVAAATEGVKKREYLFSALIKSVSNAKATFFCYIT
jgi:hypothetical protein